MSCSSCTLWVDEVREHVVAGKLHSIPRPFLNGFSAAHGFTLLKIVVVRVVQSRFLISQPLVEPKRLTMKCMVFYSIFLLYPTK